MWYQTSKTIPPYVVPKVLEYPPYVVLYVLPGVKDYPTFMWYQGSRITSQMWYYMWYQKSMTISPYRVLHVVAGVKDYLTISHSLLSTHYILHTTQNSIQTKISWSSPSTAASPRSCQPHSEYGSFLTKELEISRGSREGRIHSGTHLFMLMKAYMDLEN